jgi:hypothetical protein
MKSTQKKIALLLINTIDHSLPRREIRMRLRHRKDFESVYALLLFAHVLEETGAGTKYSPRITHLLDPAAALNG